MEDCLSVEELKEHIKKGCQDVQDVKAGLAAEHLHSNGLIRASYLSKATEADLKEAGLNVFEARVILTAWKPVGEQNLSHCRYMIQTGI